MKRIVIFLVLVIFVLFVAFVAYILRKEDTLEQQNIALDLASFSLENRTKLLVNGELLVGQNLKELENGYYDFKLQNMETGIKITLNKLWYEEYGTDYIQDEYLAKICRELVRCLEQKNQIDDMEYQLYKYVKDNYLNVKKGYVVEKITLDRFNIWAESINSECVIYIRVE